MLEEVRLNSVRLCAGRSCEDMVISHGDTRPKQGFQHAWQVFWLAVIGFDVLAFPGLAPVALSEHPYRTQLRVQPRICSLMGTAHRVLY